MDMVKIKQIARQRDIRVGTMKKLELIREIQTKEGNTACFNSGKSQECDQHDCLWRDDCQ